MDNRTGGIVRRLIMTGCLFFVVPIRADQWTDWQSARALDDIAYTNRERLMHERIMDAARTDEPQTVIVNEAGEGCQWAQLMDHNKPRWFKADDGYHRMYVKVCDDDPKN